MKDVEKLPLVAIAVLLASVAPQCGGPSQRAESTGPWLLAPRDSPLVLDISPTTKTLVTATPTEATTQHWSLRNTPEATVAVVSEEGACLTSGPATVTLDTCNPEHNRTQRWRHSDGMLRNQHSGQCLTTTEPTPGAVVASIDCATARQWKLIPITASASPSTA